MVSDRTRGIHNLCLLVQLIGATVLFWTWVGLYDVRISLSWGVLKSYLFYNEFLLLGLVAGSESNRSNYSQINSSLAAASRKAAWQLAFSLFVVFAVQSASYDKTISRAFLFSLIPVIYFGLLLSHRYLPAAIARSVFQGVHKERIVLFGRLRKAERLQPWLKNKEAIGFETVGILTDEYNPDSIHGLASLGTFGDLEGVIQKFQVTQVILVELAVHSKLLPQCTLICERLGVRLLVASDLEEQFRHSVALFEDDGLRFIGLREEPLESPFNRLLKRGLDLAVALPVVVFLLPIASCVVWCFQRWQSPGSLFHLQRRSGLQNRPFTIFKYRTMRPDHGTEVLQASQQDSRVYPAGAWLRKFSIDELPQFWNVLRGEMSVVGPRPHLIEHNSTFARALDNYHVRTFVQPGITGLAQVRGFRGRTDHEQDIIARVKCDIDYLENWSFARDCWIILRTLKQVVFPPKSAY